MVRGAMTDVPFGTPAARSRFGPASLVGDRHHTIAEVGERLAIMLADLLAGRAIAESHILLQPELIIRESSTQPHGREVSFLES